MEQDKTRARAGHAAGPVLVWFRRDLRLGDHPALTAACASGRPVIGVFLHDETVETLGAAARWRLGVLLLRSPHAERASAGKVDWPPAVFRA